MRFAATRSSSCGVFHQSALMPASLTTRVQRASSCRTSFARRSPARAGAARSHRARDVAARPAPRRPACQEFAHLRILQQCVAIGVQFRNRGGGGARGGEHAVPGLDLQLRQSLLAHRRHLGKGCRALGAHHRQHAQPAGLHVRRRRLQRRDAGLHVAADQVVQHAAQALVRHVHEIDAGLDLDQLHREMLHAAVARRAVMQLPRLAPRRAIPHTLPVFAALVSISSRIDCAGTCGFTSTPVALVAATITGAKLFTPGRKGRH